MSIYKRKDFSRWQARERLPDLLLCRAVREMQTGLVDASLGGLLFKKRIASPGAGKSGGYRTLLSARLGERYVFLHGFAKGDKANVTQAEQKALQLVGHEVGDSRFAVSFAPGQCEQIKQIIAKYIS